MNKGKHNHPSVDLKTLRIWLLNRDETVSGLARRLGKSRQAIYHAVKRTDYSITRNLILQEMSK